MNMLCCVYFAGCGLLIRFDDPEVQRNMKMLPYKIVDKEGKPYIEVKIKDGEIKVFSPEEISTMILGNMKEIAETYLKKKIENVVITAPGNSFGLNLHK